MKKMNMTKQDMVWVAVASILHSNTATSVAKADIDRLVYEMFQKKIPPTMITTHLVNSKGRDSNRSYTPSGGGRKRYLCKATDGKFRLYKNVDGVNDHPDKTGPYYPSMNALPEEYRHLITWYENEYFHS